MANRNELVEHLIKTSHPDVIVDFLTKSTDEQNVDLSSHIDERRAVVATQDAVVTAEKEAILTTRELISAGLDGNREAVVELFVRFEARSRSGKKTLAEWAKLEESAQDDQLKDWMETIGERLDREESEADALLAKLAEEDAALANGIE